MSESDTVHDVVRLVVHQFQFDVFLISSYHLAGTIIVHIQGRENRLVVLRTKWVELLQVEEKLRSDVSEVQLCINLDGSVSLLRKNVVGHVFFKPSGKFRHIFHLHG